MNQLLDLLSYPFFRLALMGIALISVASAIIGTYVITKRMVSLSGGVTHACFGGLGLGYYLGISPIAMAAVFAVGSSLGVDWLARRHRVREDSAIAVIWAIGMAIGVLFVFLTPGYVPELNTFLFGNILTINETDIYIFASFTAILVAFLVWKFRTIVTVSFDSDFARVAGLPVTFVSTVMTVLTAVGIVLTIRLVGVMLLMSMLSLPIMIAEIFVSRYKELILVSVGVSLVSCVLGLCLGAWIEVPCSALIVMVLAAVYTVCRVGRSLFHR